MTAALKVELRDLVGFLSVPVKCSTKQAMAASLLLTTVARVQNVHGVKCLPVRTSP